MCAACESFVIVGGRAYATAALHSVLMPRSDRSAARAPYIPSGGFTQMCIRVQYATTVTQPWSPTQDTLTLPAHLPVPIREKAVRAALAEMGICQPPRGAVCWCGEEVFLPPHIPAQRTVNEVTHHGA